MKREKLTFEKQYEDMRSKGIKFNIVSKEDAIEYLKKNNYYFKVKSYAKNFDSYKQTDRRGQYINLEFAYLKELAILDMHFRKLIMILSLDVEHFLKVKMMRDLASNSKEDGYDIVAQYLELDYDKRLKSFVNSYPHYGYSFRS